MGCFTLTPLLAVIPCEYPDELYLFRNQMLKPHNHRFIRLDTVPEYDGMTDRRTDRQTDRIALASTALCIASNADAL